MLTIPARARSGLWLTMPFLALLAADSWHHLLWADELHAWGLTLGSGSLPALFHNLHYEGHPGLWHLLLWIPSRLSASPDGMRIVAFLLAAAILLLIGVASPFSRTEKILLLSNYFVVWEYTAMARNYGIGLLLAMLYAMARRSGRSPLLVGLLLGAMANTNVYALFLSGFLALEFLWAGTAGADRPLLPALTRLLPGGALYLALVAISVATFFPPADISHHAVVPGGTDQGPMARLGTMALRTLVAPFVPVDLSFPASFAFPGNGLGQGRRLIAALILLPAILAAQWTVLRRAKPMAVALAATAAVSIVFPYLIYPSAIRHMGVLFIGFVTAWWIVRGQLPARSWPLLVLLSLGAAGGATAVAGQWMRPFAINDQAADFLREGPAAALPLAGDSDMRTEPVAILLHRPFYSLDCLCQDRFVRFLNRRDSYEPAMVPDRLAALADQLGRAPFILLAEARLDAPRLARIAAHGLNLTELAYFSGAERDKELAIYRVDPPAR